MRSFRRKLVALRFDLGAFRIEQRTDGVHLRPSRFEQRTPRIEQAQFCFHARIAARTFGLRLWTCGLTASGLDWNADSLFVGFGAERFTSQWFDTFQFSTADPKFNGTDRQQVAFAQTRFGHRIAVQPGAPIQRLDDDFRAITKKQCVPRVDPVFGQSNRTFLAAADQRLRLIEQNGRIVRSQSRRFQHQDP